MFEPTGPASHWSDEDLDGSVTDRFERQVDSGPDRLAIRVPGREVTYGGLDRWANGIARDLLESSIDRPETSAVLLGDRTAMIAAILGATKAGKTVLTLDPSHPEERLRLLILDSEARSIVSGGASLPLALRLAAPAGATVIDADAPRGTDRRPSLRLPCRSPAGLVYTSGSTGRPKGVVQSHLHVLWGCLVDTRRDRLTAGDRRLLLASPGAGAAISMYYALLNGAALFPFDIEASGLEALRDWITSQGITIYQSIPAVFRALARTFREGEGFPAVRLVRLGGDAVRRQDVSLFQRSFDDPCLMRIGYGSTEAGSIASRFIGARELLGDGPVAVGRPSEGIEVRLVDGSGRDARPGEPGEIVVTGAHLADGYWRRPDLTRERFSRDPAGGPARTFRTGDLGRLGPDGLLYHLGRTDLQVKIRGNRVEVEEVEAALRALPRVDDAAVAVHPGPGGENVLAGYLVWRGPPAAPREIRAGLARTLPDHMVPSVLVTLASLPLTPRGKLDRAALRPPGPGLPAEEERDSIVAPRDAVERGLAAIWERLLGTRPVDVRSDFFDIGGDSLLAVELFAEIERRMGRVLPLSSFLNASTIELLSEKLRKEPPNRWPSLVPIRPWGTRAPFYCVSWAEGEVLSYAPLAARLGPGRPVWGLRRERHRDGRPCLTGVEEMAEAYIDEIRAFQPSGPYHLGGLSAGGAVAFEMARQLVAAGQEVGALVLLEPSVPDGRDGGPHDRHDGLPLGRVRVLAEEASWYWTKWKLLEGAERGAWIRRGAARAAKVLRGPGRRGGPGRAGAGPGRDSESGTGASFAASDLLSREERLHVDRFVPKAYPGRATLFLAAHRRFHDDPRTIWQPLALAGLTIRIVPGFHSSIIQEPFVRILAPQVEECLSDGRVGD